MKRVQKEKGERSLKDSKNESQHQLQSRLLPQHLPQLLLPDLLLDLPLDLPLDLHPFLSQHLHQPQPLSQLLVLNLAQRQLQALSQPLLLDQHRPLSGLLHQNCQLIQV